MNQLFVIFPFKDHNQWMFTDASTSLVREPFILGVDAIMDRATAEIPQAENGFKLIFSAAPFPQFTVKLEWRREESGGNWYYCPQYGIEGWVCGALYRYLDVAPKVIYARAEAK